MNSESDEKWMDIHGTLKSMVYSAVASILATFTYVSKYKRIKLPASKDDLRNHELKLLWCVWDRAFDGWEKEIGFKYRDSKKYQTMLRFRNILFMIVDNDCYIKLLRHSINEYEKIKGTDEYLK